MDIAEKIHLTFDDLDQERLMSVAITCLEMVNPLRLDLSLCRNDQKKMKIIQSKRKQAKEKIKEMAIRSQYAVSLYYQHLDIEFNKAFSFQSSNLPDTPDGTSIFNVKISRPPDSEDQYNGMDHLECALTNAQKVCQDSIVWTIFYSELEDMEQEVKQGVGFDKPEKLSENASSVKASGEWTAIGKKDQTGLPANEPLIPAKFLQIFKEGGAELFEYFQSEYTLDDQSPVAKYSYIYHFLTYEQLIIARCQSKYIEFIKESFGVNMSKILPENDRFEDHIHPLLSRLKSNFGRKSKSEQK